MAPNAGRSVRLRPAAATVRFRLVTFPLGSVTPTRAVETAPEKLTGEGRAKSIRPGTCEALTGIRSGASDSSARTEARPLNTRMTITQSRSGDPAGAGFHVPSRRRV